MKTLKNTVENSEKKGLIKIFFDRWDAWGERAEAWSEESTRNKVIAYGASATVVFVALTGYEIVKYYLAS